jgi:hypothetical protein
MREPWSVAAALVLLGAGAAVVSIQQSAVVHADLPAACSVQVDRWATAQSNSLPGNPGSPPASAVTGAGILGFERDTTLSTSTTPSVGEGAQVQVDTTAGRWGVVADPSVTPAVNFEWDGAEGAVGVVSLNGLGAIDLSTLTAFTVRGVDAQPPGTLTITATIYSGSSNISTAVASIVLGAGDADPGPVDVALPVGSFVVGPGATGLADLASVGAVTLSVQADRGGYDFSIGSVELGCAAPTVPPAGSTCPFVLDSWGTPQSVVAGPVPSVVANSQRGVGIFGGERDMVITRTVGTGVGFGNASAIGGGGTLTQSLELRSRADLRFVWDGVDDDPIGLDPEGLEGFDLADLVSFTSVVTGEPNASLTARLILVSAVGGASTSTVVATFNDEADPVPLLFDAASFATTGTGPVDLTNLTAIVLELVSSRSGLDFTLAPISIQCSRVAPTTTTTPTTTIAPVEPPLTTVPGGTVPPVTPIGPGAGGQLPATGAGSLWPIAALLVGGGTAIVAVTRRRPGKA